MDPWCNFHLYYIATFEFYSYSVAYCAGTSIDQFCKYFIYIFAFQIKIPDYYTYPYLFYSCLLSSCIQILLNNYNYIGLTSFLALNNIRCRLKILFCTILLYIQPCTLVIHICAICTVHCIVCLIITNNHFET